MCNVYMCNIYAAYALFLSNLSVVRNDEILQRMGKAIPTLLDKCMKRKSQHFGHVSGALSGLDLKMIIAQTHMPHRDEVDDVQRR